jgi:hypothetical protein
METDDETEMETDDESEKNWWLNWRFKGNWSANL